MKKQFLATIGLVFAAQITVAATVDNTAVTTFQADTPAVAAEVNSTVQALITAINDNAARITELEATTAANSERVAELEADSTDNSVAERTYKVLSFNADLGAGDGNNDGTNDFVNVSTGAADFQIAFFANGTGQFTVNADESYEVNVPNFLLTDFSDSEIAITSFTYTQPEGSNQVTLTIPEDGDSFDIVFTVAASGSVIIGQAVEPPSPDTFGDGSPGTVSFLELLVGVKLLPSN